LNKVLKSAPKSLNALLNRVNSLPKAPFIKPPMNSSFTFEYSENFTTFIIRIFFYIFNFLNQKEKINITDMEWNEYKMLSEKTLSTEFHCGKQVENLLHGVSGVITELEELLGWNDEVNKKEEVADVFWYIALLDRELNLNLELPTYTKEFTQLKNDALIISSFKISSLLLDSLKKKLFYNKNIEFDLFSVQCKSLFDNMCVFCEVNSIDVNSILHTNIEKLKARYGEKFSSHRAINRDLEKERTILEQ
jgi:hypothetical protein